jgi:hypothetical protein
MSAALFAAWCLLAATQLGWLPFARHAWGFTLWAYLPGWAAGLLAAASLALCAPRVRAGVVAAAAAAARRVPRGPLAPAAAAAAVALAFWLVRERTLAGDSAVLVAAAHGGHAFVFPEVGATFLLRACLRAGTALGMRPVEAMRVLACACGGAATWWLLRLARELAPGLPAAAVALFFLSGGLARVFAGRVEVYAPLLVALLGYLGAALRAVRGEGRVGAAALWLGAAIWLHAAAVLLVPSLLAVPLLRQPALARREAWSRGIGACALAALPLAGFLVGQVLAAGAGSLAHTASRALEILGRGDAPDATRWWVRGRGGAPSIGTDVVLLGRAQLKYLSNSFHVLVPAALPLLALGLLRRPRALVAGPAGRLLACAALPLALYALALRPFWGPWDWDLFAATALVLGCFAVRVLAELRAAHGPGLVAAVIGMALLFVGIPFLWIGAGAPRDVGPFGFRGFDYDLRRAGAPPPERLAPWL